MVHDYQAYFAGEPVEAGKAEGTYVEVGSGKFNAEFEKNLLGLMEGAESRFAVDLPNDFANPLLAGKVGGVSGKDSGSEGEGGGGPG